jgi:hypothetical protein
MAGRRPMAAQRADNKQAFDFKFKATQKEQALETLRLGWNQFFPAYSVCSDDFFYMWLLSHHLSTILAAFEFLAADLYFRDTLHLARVVSITLRNVTYTT